MAEDTATLSAAEMKAKECSFWRYIIYCDNRGGYRERVRYGKSRPNYVGQYLLTVSESLVSVLCTETLNVNSVNCINGV